MQCVFKQHFPVLSVLIYNHNNFAININLIKCSTCMIGEYRGSNVVAYKLVEPLAYFPEHLRTLCCCCKILFHRQSSWELIYVSRPFSFQQPTRLACLINLLQCVVLHFFWSTASENMLIHLLLCFILAWS